MLCVVLGGCALLPQPEIVEPLIETPTGWTSAKAASYVVDEAQLILYTYRAGWLKDLAHNHVMTTTKLAGAIDLAEPISHSSASIYFRPWDLILDEPAARAAAGAGFESERTPADIAATRTRMLGPQGFASNDHPFVVIEVSWVNDSRVGLAVSFRDAVVDLEAPVSWSHDQERLSVTADFELSHRTLGIAPYSAFAGAIAVADTISVRLSLSAERNSY